MTEAEAKTKWCPMVRYERETPWLVSKLAGKKVFSYSGQSPNGNCVGSGCMLWRWNPVKQTTSKNKKAVTLKYDGYCGLAGRP